MEIEWQLVTEDDEHWMVLVKPPKDFKLPGILGKLLPEPKALLAAVIHDPMGMEPELEIVGPPLPLGLVDSILYQVRTVKADRISMN